MYQESIDNFKEEFEFIIKVFKEFMKINSSLIEDNSEWNLKAEYKPNHACIWNKIKYIGINCKIIVKNNEYAIVAFNKFDNVPILERIYRLEDLSLVN